MGATLQSGSSRLAVGAVVGAVTAALFTTGVISGSASQGPRDQGGNAAVEPIPPGEQPSRSGIPTTTPTSSTTSSTVSSTTTTPTTSTTTTTSSDDDDDPPPPVTTTTTRHTPPPTTTRTTTTTTCSSLICVG